MKIFVVYEQYVDGTSDILKAFTTMALAEEYIASKHKYVGCCSTGTYDINLCFDVVELDGA